jgi:ADP-heptose:LPS heptosyltransferase
MNANPMRCDRTPASCDVSPAELEHLAANGETENVRSLFAGLVPGCRAPYASPRVLELVVRGGITRLRSVPPHARRAADSERALVQSALQLLLDPRPAGHRLPRQAFEALLEWSEYLRDASQLAEALSFCDTAIARGARHYPDLHPRLVLARASVLEACGRLPEAHAELTALYRRPDLISERNVVPELVRALGRTALHVGEAALFKRLLLDGLGAFYSNMGERRAILDLLCRTHRGALRFLISRGTKPADKLLFLAHWTCLRGSGLLRGRAARPLERGLLACLYLYRYLRPGQRRPGARPAAGDEATAARVLVTRAMGGAGDLLMMTPGLRVLAQRHPGRVDFAVPRNLFPVLENNPDVRLIDIHSEIDPQGYGSWFNLTDCPAARIESLTAPRVRQGRIESFARATGTHGRSLRRMERRPRYFPTARELEERQLFFAVHGLAGRAVIGVQYRSDESYRDYPHMRPLIEALAREYRVLVFDSQEVRDCGFPGVVHAVGRPLREAFALASGCQAIVAPDSVFVHLAGALDLPCLALFGPTDGRVRTAEYPRCRFLDVRRELRCIPCWRNERIPCALTDRHASVCLAEIRVADVVEALHRLLSEQPARPPVSRPGGVRPSV